MYNFILGLLFLGIEVMPQYISDSYRCALSGGQPLFCTNRNITNATYLILVITISTVLCGKFFQRFEIVTSSSLTIIIISSSNVFILIKPTINTLQSIKSSKTWRALRNNLKYLSNCLPNLSYFIYSFIL